MAVTFTPEDYARLATLLRDNLNAPSFNALLANNFNVILGALDATAASQWQPIETAPSGDDCILVYCADTKEQFVVARLTSLEDGDSAWVISRSLGAWPVAFVCRSPTHWRPLPAPPAAQPEAV